jgi:pimeloyl-ACP methyl ester carboxylesterase
VDRDVDWELVEAGPADPERVVLLLPGGFLRARSYAEVMARPELAGVRLVSATLPGHGGTPSPDDFGIEAAAEQTAKLAARIGSDVVVGFSMGATVAFEMVMSGAVSGAAVLIGISLSLEDEARFLRAFDKLTVVTGHLPFSVMRQMMGPMMKQSRLPDDRGAELLDDLRRNDPQVMRRLVHEYLRYLGRLDSPATRLCDAKVPTWIVHAEKGDGELTDGERSTLDACPNVEVQTIPAESFLLPNEHPEEIAQVITAALAAR